MIENKSKFTSKNTGILLISHGSRHPLASETFNKIADMFREESDFKVNVGYMEIHKPNIPTALDDLVKDTEIDTVIVVPVFLAHGMHTTRDIPKILNLADFEEEGELGDNHNHNHNHNQDNENEHNKHHHNHRHHDQEEKHKEHNHHHDFEKINFNGKIIYTEPLGADPLVLEIIKNRVNRALESN